MPYALRVDLHDAQQQGAIFIPLDSQTGVASNVSVAWALPAAGGGGGGDWSLRVTTPLSAGNASAWATVVSLSGPGGGAQAAAFPRSALRAATAYDVAVRVDGGAWSQALRFYTSASQAAHWAATAPVWPAKCAGGGGPAQPRFAAFRGAARLAPLPPAADGILSALVYATAAPPIYGDPWNVTKLFSGFKLYANGTLAGMGPGHAACGPYAMSSCAAVQPADGFDLTAMARASAAAGSPLALAATAYGLAQHAVLNHNS